jgi:hypothetical protein
MRRGVAYASCGHAFHPICLLEYEKHAGQRAVAENATKCPLCRQPYTVKHFIPDDNLRSLCLEHTLNQAIVMAEAAAKEADEKVKEAGQARVQAAHAAQHAVRLRQQAGTAFCSSTMANRLSVLTQAARTGNSSLPAASLISGAASTSTTPSARPAPSLLARASARADNRSAASFMPGTSVARPNSSMAAAARRMHNSPAAVAAAVVAAAPVAADPGPGFDLGVHVPLHEQIATMRISADAETLHSAAQHPDVVLGIEEPE